jgi:hypothetical protein
MNTDVVSLQDILKFEGMFPTNCREVARFSTNIDDCPIYDYVILSTI